jgi:RNA polymerase sigma-70 factor (ECF subfamily)
MSAAVARTSENDAALIERIADGDMEALGTLYDRHHDAVLRFAFRAGPRHEAEDVTQATFLAAAKIARTFDGRISARPWLLGIAANVMHTRRRSASRFARMLHSLASWCGRAMDPQERLAARSELSAVDRALAKMTEAKRVVLIMAEVEDLPASDISQALGIPVGTVWTRLHAARRELREALKGDAR